TRMPVVEVKDGMRVEVGHVYVMPPNTRMTIVAGVLNLTPRSDDRGPHMPIDHFLRSLADDLKSRAIGVILSGSASDGALGLKTIRRRIARRMLIHGVGTLEAYRRYLEEHPSQVQALSNDLLVNVTRFFRDTDAFRILERSVFPSIIKQRPADAPIRIWAPGCAT